MMIKLVRALLTGAAMASASTAIAADTPPPLDGPSAAKLLGAREFVQDISISPDGTKVVFVEPGDHHGRVAVVMDVASGAMAGVAKMDGNPLNLESCGWASNARLVCRLSGMLVDQNVKVPFSRTIALDPDGKNVINLGRRAGVEATRLSQYDGNVIDWMDGSGVVLMTRDYVPEEDVGTRISSTRDGLGVDRVDTATGKGVPVEPPQGQDTDFIADGQGHVRIMSHDETDGSGQLTGNVNYLYRKAGTRNWMMFSRVTTGASGAGGGQLVPIAVDGTRDVAFAIRTLDGRDALYSVALDGTMKTELVFSRADVDVNSVVTIGRHGRVIGARYVTDKQQVEYFDPEYKALAAALARAIPQLPLIRFVDASADESQLLVYASSDVDPGRFYVFDKRSRHLDEVVQARPGLQGRPMATMASVSFNATDGTTIPAYLTLPPGMSSPKNLPAIVMPHGGPGYRDEWGFDWLVQFFAQRGYAVIQPEFRGSTGYGDAFYAKNGFQSWQLAISDVCDAGRYLVKAGIADPSKLAIVGWSYGGYAALQANVVDPTLFKAVVAVAPVTDLGMIKTEAQDYTSARLVQKQIGSGDVVAQGSPDRHADKFQAPVLMFHGDQDMNVDISESRAMDSALHRAGKSSTLVVFPGLDHQLDDADARARMLGQADDFLRTSLKL